MIVDITTKDNETYSITRREMISSSYQQDSSSDNEFVLGFASACSLSFSMKDLEEQYTDVDFLESTCVMWDDEKLVRKGLFYLKKLTKRDDVYNFEFIDNMTKFDKRFKEQEFSGNIVSLLQLICRDCGITLYDYSKMLNQDIIIKNSDELLNMNYREILQAICEATGTFAIIDEFGRLVLDWYTLEQPTEIAYYQLHDFEIEEAKSAPKEVSGVINGVEVKSWSTSPSGYVLYITNNNPILMNHTEADINSYLANIKNNRLINDFEYNSLELRTRINWNLKVGDCITVEDKKGNWHFSIITNIAYRNDSNMTITCSGENHDRDYTTINKKNAEYSSSAFIFGKKETTDKTTKISILNVRDSSQAYLNLSDLQLSGSVSVKLNDSNIKTINKYGDMSHGFVLNLEKTMNTNELEITGNGVSELEISLILVNCTAEETVEPVEQYATILEYPAASGYGNNLYETCHLEKEEIIEGGGE